MSKFHVGDKIIGNEYNKYSITKKGWIGFVMDPEKSALIKEGYQLLPNRIIVYNPRYPNEEFVVNEQCFDLYDRPAISREAENEFKNLIFDSCVT